MILSPHFLFLFSHVFTADTHCKSPILVGNLVRIVLPMNPLCTKWKARGQAVCLLLIKPFDQSLFNSAHVVLWAPPVCRLRARLVQQSTCSSLYVAWNNMYNPHFSAAFFSTLSVHVKSCTNKSIILVIRSASVKVVSTFRFLVHCNKFQCTFYSILASGNAARWL